MNQLNERATITLPYVIITFIAVTATWAVHEFAHWGIGEMLGNRMVMTLNTCYPVIGKYQQSWHEHVISAAGPVITLLQAFLFYFLMKRNPNKFLFPFLLTCLYMRTLAGVMNVINLNDEGRISKALGVGAFTLPFLVFVILFYLVYDIARMHKIKTKFIVVTILLIMFFSSVVILSDQMLGLILINQ